MILWGLILNHGGNFDTFSKFIDATSCPFYYRNKANEVRFNRSIEQKNKRSLIAPLLLFYTVVPLVCPFKAIHKLERHSNTVISTIIRDLQHYDKLFISVSSIVSYTHRTFIYKHSCILNFF